MSVKDISTTCIHIMHIIIICTVLVSVMVTVIVQLLSRSYKPFLCIARITDTVLPCHVYLIISMNNGGPG